MRNGFALFLAAVLLAGSAAWADSPYTVSWSRQIGTIAYDDSTGVAADASGNAFIAGSTYGSLYGASAGGADAFLTKYGSTGSVQWTRQLGTAGDEFGYSVAVDHSGNAFLAGSTTGGVYGTNFGGADAFLTKYDALGNVQWSRQLGTASEDQAKSVATDAAGNAYITGYTSGAINGSSAGYADAFLTKYDAAGNLQWSRQIGTALNDKSYAVAIDAATGSAYITGYTAGAMNGPNAGAHDAFLAKYDTNGNAQWSRQLGTTTNDDAWSVATDSAGNAYLAGSTLGGINGSNVGGSDAFLAKYDSSGAFKWSRQVGTASDDYGNSVAVDGAGNIFLGGSSYGVLGASKQGNDDAFLTKFDSAGSSLWSAQLGTSGYDYGWSVAADGSGNVFLSGSTDGSLGGANAGDSDGFLVKFAAPFPGDANGDGVVSFKDYIVLEVNFGATSATFAQGDFNGDGVVSFKDYIILESNFGKSSVPEPTTVAVLVAGGMLALRRRAK